MWRDWALYHLENLKQDEMGSDYELLSEFTTMSVLAMNYWLGEFLLEVNGTKVARKLYCPDSLYQLCCRLLRSLREANHAEVTVNCNYPVASYCMYAS